MNRAPSTPVPTLFFLLSLDTPAVLKTRAGGNKARRDGELLRRRRRQTGRQGVRPVPRGAADAAAHVTQTCGGVAEEMRGDAAVDRGKRLWRECYIFSAAVQSGVEAVCVCFPPRLSLFPVLSL